MIQLNNIYKSFGTNQVLKGVSFDIAEGEVFTIMGQSGCGKSILVKHMVGILKPDSGDITIDEKSIVTAGRQEQTYFQKKFGVLFQGAALFDSLTVYENVIFGLRTLTDLPEHSIKKIAEEKLSIVGLQNVENLKPSELSGGMKKRVGLARAIAYEPKYIFYDEPTTGLDPIMANVINNLILDLKRKLNITSIVVTHDINSAYKISDKIAMTAEGKIIEIGTPDEIKNTENPIVRQFITGNVSGPIKIGEQV